MNTNHESRITIRAKRQFRRNEDNHEYIIIGTAGHIDHGKTSLIEALSGYNGDELEEEKQRGITIDLSFSNMQRGDKNIAFIDVPGHKRLIKNMISGAFGFDLCLFTVAANEGIMPQTIEHLEVLNFLGVKDILFVITKCDLVDKNSITQREQEIKELLKNYPDTNLLDIKKVSVKDKQSINELKEYLFSLKRDKEQISEKFFRYYIDRVFSVKGFGEVVTGTVLNGFVKVNDKVLVSELGVEINVKNIQVHSKNVPIASKHQRAALNLNIPHGKLKKGYLLTTKGYFRGFNAIEAYIKSASGKELQHNLSVQFISGAKSIGAKVYLYDVDINDGNLAKITFEDKMYLMHGDSFIILHNGSLMGGGIVLDPLNDPIKKSKKVPILLSLLKKDYKTAFSLLSINHKKGFGLVSSIQRFGKTHEEALQIAKTLEDIFVDEKELVLYPLSTKEILKNEIKSIYEKNPYAMLSPSSIALRAKWASYAFIKSVLDEFVKSGFLEITNNIYKRVDIGDIDFEKELSSRVLQILENEGFAPTAPYNLYDRLDIDRKLGDKTLKKLTSSKKVVRIAHNLFITTSNLAKIVALQKEIIKNEGYIDIKNFKEKLNLSRKYLIGYLEYLDKFDEIKREGNKRVFAA